MSVLISFLVPGYTYNAPIYLSGQCLWLIVSNTGAKRTQTHTHTKSPLLLIDQHKYMHIINLILLSHYLIDIYI